MLTREEKREREKNKNFFFDFVKIQNHFFRDFVQQLKRVNDNRHQSYITYGTEVILYTILLKNVFGIKSMRRMTEQLNKDECIENIRTSWAWKSSMSSHILTQLMTFYQS